MDNIFPFFLIPLIILYLAILVLIVASIWKIFVKADKPGWAAIIPFFNLLIWLEIARKPWWWFFLMVIPYVGLIWGIWSLNRVVKAFGKDEGFTIGCLFLPFIFLPILAFGDSIYLKTNNNEDYTSEILDADIQ